MSTELPTKIFALLSAAVFAISCGEPEPIELSNQNQDDDGAEHNHSQPPSQPECMPVMTQPDACGGHIEGSWENAEVCSDFELQETFDQFGCTDADVRTFDYWVGEGSGTIEFDDGSLVRDLEVVVDLDMHIPQYCIDFANIDDCDSFASTAEQYVGLPLACSEPETPNSDEAPGCDCIADEVTVDRSVTGSYDVDEDTRLITVEPGSDQYYYCAEDGVLNLRSVGGDEDLPMTEAYTFVP